MSSRRRRTLAVGGIVALTLGVALTAYLAATEAIVTEPRYLLYPIVWIAVAAGVLAYVADGRPDWHPLAAFGVVCYLLVLSAANGALALGGTGTGMWIEWLPPGWGPMLRYDGTLVSVVVVPFETVGHLALGALVYVLFSRATGAAGVGALGLVTCVGCTWPVLAGVAGGGGLSVLGAIGSSYDLSTAFFVLTVGLLLWVERLSRAS